MVVACFQRSVGLIVPGALRILSLKLSQEFPFHPNWKMSKTQGATSSREGSARYGRDSMSGQVVDRVAERGEQDE